MEKSNLIRILQSFNKKEARELRKWLHSPAHNSRDDVIQLYEYLLEDNHLQKSEALEKEKAFTRVYPGLKTYDDAKMRQTMFFLSQTMEEFLVYQELREDEVRAKIILAGIYRKRNLDKPFSKNMKAARNLQEKQEHKNSFYLQNEYLLLQEDYLYLASHNRAVPLNLQEISDSLDASYLAEKLRQTCYMRSHQKLYSTHYEIGLIDEVIKFVEEKQLLNIPAIAMYYYGLKTIIDRENGNHFQNLKMQMASNSQLFPQTEIRTINVIAINYCIEEINRGNKLFFRELFEIYRRGLDIGVMIDNGVLSRFTFKNVVNNGLYLKEYEWIENFIEDYQIFLEDKYRDSSVHYSRAKLYFEKGDYDEAMELLSQADYDDILLNLSAKTMLMKMFYEKEAYDALESLLESMRTYIQRKKVLGYHKSNYKNIIRYTKKLLKVNPYNKNLLSRLRNEVKAANPLTEQEWILRQLEKTG